MLIVEDNPDDAELVLRELRRGGFEPVWERVETAEDFSAALTHEWDVILTDFSMPHFNAFGALEILEGRQNAPPCIVVSGTIGEDTAVAAIKAGAADYIMKDRLARLAGAIRRELRDRAIRRLHEAEQRKAHEAIRKLLAAIEQTVDSIVMTDPDGRINYVNPGFQKLYGYSREEVAGKTPRVLKSGQHDAAYYRTFWGTLISGAGFRGEIVNRAKDGRLVTVEMSASAIFDETGKRTGYIAVHHDISEKKRAEDSLRASETALRKSELRLRTVIETEPECVKAVDRSGRVVDMNAAGLAMLEAGSLSEVQQRPLLDFLLPAVQGFVCRPAPEGHERGKRHPSIRNQRPQRLAALAGHPRRSTEERQRRDRLLAGNHARHHGSQTGGRRLAGVAEAASGALDAPPDRSGGRADGHCPRAARRARPGPDGAEDGSHVDSRHARRRPGRPKGRSAKNRRGLAGRRRNDPHRAPDFLGASPRDARRPRPPPFDRMARAGLLPAHRNFRSDRVGNRFRRARPGAIDGDLPDLQETLTNVARHSNATEVSGLVRESGGAFELEIRDNGKGFPLSHSARSFFPRPHRNARAGRVGRGIDRIPFGAGGRNDRPIARAAPGKGSVMRVFVADDSAPVRERILSMLEGIPGVQVVGHAEDSIAARLLITALQPDVVILDINMPGGSGIEVLHEIKRPDALADGHHADELLAAAVPRALPRRGRRLLLRQVVRVRKDPRRPGAAEVKPPPRGRARPTPHALRVRKPRLKELSESEVVLLCTHDLGGTLLSINGASCRALGYTESELLGGSIRDVLAAEYRDQFEAYLARLRASGAATGVMTVVTRNGEKRLWHYQNILSVGSESDPVVHGTAIDVTELIEANRSAYRELEQQAEALRRAKEYSDTLIRTANVMILGLDPEGRVEIFNEAAEKMTGYRRRSSAGEAGSTRWSRERVFPRHGTHSKRPRRPGKLCP